ncbi:MAG: hypothetical protein IBX60_07955 [Candidatus Aminicenantes bacterium]|nr:hypothetical protein [Candidatus Aminicenantes bacterium]
MVSEKRRIFLAIFFIFIFFLGFSLFVNLPSLQGNFLFADEAIYYSMAQSLAHDGDLEYSKRDLNRYYQTFDSGPLGIFLKKGENGKIFFAKSFAYPLFVAPFVRIFGVNGFLVFHAILLFLLLLMGYSYFSLSNSPLLSFLSILTFFFASVACVYYIWISPDFFNLFLVFAVLFLLHYKQRYHNSINLEVKTPLQNFLLSDSSDYLASILAGIAVFSKPPNIVLLGPLVLYPLIRKKFGKTFLVIVLFAITSSLFWGVNYLHTGDWNYQGGERKTFYFSYPLERENFTFDSIGSEMTSAGYGSKHLLPAKVTFYNMFYYFFGRFTGIIWYFFPAFLFLVVFILQKKRWDQWLIFTVLSAEILIYITLMPDNYAGGGGALANRYFLNVYPFFLFLIPMRRNFKEIALCWIMASIFISQIFLSPFISSHYPSTHAKQLPFKMLPVELTLVNNLPTNTNPKAFRQEVGIPPHIGWLHFLDDNFHPKLEPTGFWTKGSHTAEMILKTYYPVKKLEFHLLNNPRKRNKITVKVGTKKQTVLLGQKQRGTLSFSPGNGFQIKAIHLYKIKIKASKGAIPYLEDKKFDERRFLGVFFEIEIIPED